MKVVHLNTELNITSAPYKLHRALVENGVDSRLLIFNYPEDLNEGDRLSSPEHTLDYKIKRRVCALKRKRVIERYKQNELMPFSAIPVGLDISGHEFITWADIICIHWTGGDYLSPSEIEKLLKLKKPVFMFCHDNAPFTGGCHVRLGCENYKAGCGRCPQLSSDDAQDITSKLVELKTKCYNYPNLYVISVSKWMDNNVRSSMVFKEKPHFIVSNAVNTEQFCMESVLEKLSKTEAKTKADVKESLGIPRDKRVLLVGLKADERIPYNGMDKLWKVLEKYKNMTSHKDDLCIVSFGAQSIADDHGLDILNLGYVKDQDRLAALYVSADVYLVSSLEDSFNQTVAECMSSGTPVVAFNNGGIADIIDHQENGYLAELGSVDQLVQGLIYLEDKDFGDKARRKILDNFSYEKVSEKFIKLAKGFCS